MADNKRQKLSAYANKKILAPMVRVGTLPFRLLCLRHGADLVYSQEIIDYKLIATKRVVNSELNTIDFINNNGAVVFRTCEEERKHVVVQIGTNNPERAVRAANVVANDVAGVDINMGCPKSFSLSGGMGAALLDKPELITDILNALTSSMKIPVTCKIRCLSDLKATVDLAKRIEATGVDALAVHGRTKTERNQNPNRDEYIAAIAEALTIPVICNGASSSINTHEDLMKFKQRTKTSSVMVARSAMKNCSIFNPDNDALPLQDRIAQYLKLAIEYDNHAINSKYCIQQMLGSLQEEEQGKQLLSSYDLESIAKIYGMHEFYLEHKEKRLRIREANNKRTDENEPQDPNDVRIVVDFKIGNFDEHTYPKNILHRWLVANDKEVPVYTTREINKHYHSVVCVSPYKYSTPVLEKTKRYAEQAAALVAIISMNLVDKSEPRIEQSIVNDPNRIQTIEHREKDVSYLIRVNK